MAYSSQRIVVSLGPSLMSEHTESLRILPRPYSSVLSQPNSQRT